MASYTELLEGVAMVTYDRVRVCSGNLKEPAKISIYSSFHISDTGLTNYLSEKGLLTGSRKKEMEMCKK